MKKIVSLFSGLCAVMFYGSHAQASFSRSLELEESHERSTPPRGMAGGLPSSFIYQSPTDLELSDKSNVNPRKKKTRKTIQELEEEFRKFYSSSTEAYSSSDEENTKKEETCTTVKNRQNVPPLEGYVPSSPIFIEQRRVETPFLFEKGD